MGWSCSWIAVRGKEPAALLTSLGMHLSQEREEFPESPWTAASLRAGWFLVFCSNHCDPARFKSPALADLSADCELVHSSVEEHVMFSSTAYWRHGKQVWQIVHDAQKEIYHLHTSGDLPAYFFHIRPQLFAEQEAEGGATADVDLIFDIPLQVGAELTGFRHDHACPADEADPYQVVLLDERSPGAKPWWKVW